LRRIADKETIKSLGDPKALLSPKARKSLEKKFDEFGSNGKVLFSQTVEAINGSMLAGVKSVFIFGAVTMLMAFLLILTVPEVSMDAVVEDKKAPQPEAVQETA
jgi:hypothetical protein